MGPRVTTLGWRGAVGGDLRRVRGVACRGGLRPPDRLAGDQQARRAERRPRCATRAVLTRHDLHARVRPRGHLAGRRHVAARAPCARRGDLRAHVVQDDGRLLTTYITRVKGPGAASTPAVYRSVDQSFHLLTLFATALVVHAAT